MSTKAQVTRRTIVGFGYNAGCSEHWNESMTQSWLAPDPTERPDHTGTILQVQQAISEDRTLASFQNGGTYYTTAWFVKVGGKWHRMKHTDENQYLLNTLTMEQERRNYQYDGQKYYADSVLVEVE